MALFPAYAEIGTGKDNISIENDIESQALISSENEDESVITPESEERLLNYVEEIPVTSETVESSSSEAESQKDDQNSKKRKHKSKKKKKDKKKARVDCEKYKYHSIVDFGADYYVDMKSDYGNLRVSTLYNPARPQYDYIHTVLGRIFRKPKIKQRSKNLRYFNTRLDTSAEQPEAKKSKKQGRARRDGEGYIDITDSGITWSDSRIEEDLQEQTAHFNKHLHTNPYDVDTWLKYVQLQEDTLAFDICNGRAGSEAQARSVCHTRQIAILNKALEKNYNSMELLSKKVKISEQSLPNDQYLSMLKQLVLMPELSSPLLTRVWFWYVESVQCSMALCSVPAVKEMYAAAVKGLLKVHKDDYQRSHVDVTYRLGLFLRQAGMWEQLWMLVKMNIDMNLSLSRDHEAFSLRDILPAGDENALIAEETKLMSSGLPVHAVWCRVEALRAREHWRPTPPDDDAGDPQRVVFSTDLADYIKPVTNETHRFTLIVNMIRLYKVPLLPARHTTHVALTPNEARLEWERDSVESALPLLYATLHTLGPRDPLQLKILATIFKDFSEHPNYFDVTGSYYQFVSNLMLQFAKSLFGPEAMAILIWWVRLQRCIVAANSWRDISDQKATCGVVRRAVKELLKARREDALLYGEFALLEGQIFGKARGLAVMDSALRAAPSDTRVHLSRTYVEMLLMDCRDYKNILMAINVLVALAAGDPLPKDLLTPCSDQDIAEAIQKFGNQTDGVLLAASQFDREMFLWERMSPEPGADWLACHAWLLYLSQTHGRPLQTLYRKLNSATYVLKVECKALDSKRLLWLRENMQEFFISMLQSRVRECPGWEDQGEVECALKEGVLLEAALAEIPEAMAPAWAATGFWAGGPAGRRRLTASLARMEQPATLATALLFRNLLHLYTKEVPCYEDVWQPGHTHRLLALLRGLGALPGLACSALLWKVHLSVLCSHAARPPPEARALLYRALDLCPWDKGLYTLGCVLIPPEFAELVDLMVEKQIRLHTMPEELQPL